MPLLRSLKWGGCEMILETTALLPGNRGLRARTPGSRWSSLSWGRMRIEGGDLVVAINQGVRRGYERATCGSPWCQSVV